MSVTTWLKSCVNKSVYFRPVDNSLPLSEIKATGFQGSFNYNRYRTGYDLIHERYVLAHENDIWTDASHGFYTLAKDLAPHSHFFNRVKTPSVPDNIFNAWVDYSEHFDWHEYSSEDDEDFNIYRKIKRVVKYFETNKLNDAIILSEVDYTQFNCHMNIRIEEPKFYDTVRELTHDFFANHNFEHPETATDYDGDFDEGWALGRLAIESKTKNKTVNTKFGPVTGTWIERLPVSRQEYEDALKEI